MSNSVRPCVRKSVCGSYWALFAWTSLCVCASKERLSIDHFVLFIQYLAFQSSCLCPFN